MLPGLILIRSLALSPLQGTPGLGEEDVVQARLVELEVRDLDIRLVEGADDVGELLAALLEPNRRPLGRPGDQFAEGTEQLDGAVAVGVVGRYDLDRGAADLRLEGVGGALGDELALIDDSEVVGELIGLLEVLGGEEDRHALVAGEVGDLVPEGGAALDVEARGRFVQEEDPRPVQKRQRQVESALHASRVVADLAVGRIGEADTLDQLVAAPGSVGLRHSVEGALEPHVVPGGQIGVERCFLKGCADRVTDGGAVLDDVVTGHPRRSGGGREEGGQHVDRGRLAGAVRAEEAVDLTRPDLEVDSVDGAHAALELADEAAHLDPVGFCRHSVAARHPDSPSGRIALQRSTAVYKNG